ncbi:helix-turn-helix domain-containing protein [uncultured Kriegella sp.]|uniref:helix-turn-helix domain-containing protein n=1 Tax=uncultured Kriegella sp. TaxID=1798910 RepID=UPI0030DA81FD|tara:strand:+ start:48377 stop:48970 length:594 start_codon:yes stop_codon:yes gene_type:complete
MNNLNLAQRVKDLRNRKGISQEVLAEESGLSLRTIQRIENNETVPRGDTLKRLAITLDTSPDEIVDWKIQEDQNYLTIMSLSALGFLFFPILGIIIPLTMWIFKKDKLKNVNELGKSMLNFQISWTLSLFLYYIFIIIGMFGGGFRGILPNWNFGIFTMFIPLIILYAYNIIVTVYNTIRVYNRKSFKYRPALRILR